MSKEEREDAIKFFKEVSEKEVNNCKYSKLAIEALEQQTCDDTVNRQTMIDMIKDIHAVIEKYLDLLS